MNKTELIEQVAKQTGMSKAAVTRALDAFLDTITQGLKKGCKISLIGFGNFAVRQREARTGHNPKTLEKVEIKSAKVPYFKVGKRLRELVN